MTTSPPRPHRIPRYWGTRQLQDSSSWVAQLGLHRPYLDQDDREGAFVVFFLLKPEFNCFRFWSQIDGTWLVCFDRLVLRRAVEYGFPIVIHRQPAPEWDYAIFQRITEDYERDGEQRIAKAWA